MALSASLRSASILSLTLLVGLGSGCNSCSGKKKSATSGDEDVAKKEGKKKGKKKKKKRSRTDKDPNSQNIRLHDLTTTPNAAVVRSGEKVWMWVDGRSSAISQPVDAVAWSKGGFEFAAGNGFTKVLAPGGSFYYRAKVGEQPATQPLKSLLGKPSSPPEGFAIDYIDGAGGTKVQAILTGPEKRRVRLGLFAKVPDEQIWLEGSLPTDGKASAPLSARVGFKKDGEGDLLNQVPDTGTAVAWGEVGDADLKEWMEAAQAFGKNGAKLTPGVKVAADLDRDGFEEAILCFDGEIGMLDPRCVLVDIVNDETRMYAIGLPWQANGNQPVAFSVDGSPYALMISTKDPKVGFVLRYYGAGWMAEPIR